MASEEPLFDPSLKKKKKKKTVAFTEDPLGADADPTTPAQDDGGDETGAPATVHEQVAQRDAEAAAGDDDAMFEGLKKKKKKKEIPLDLVSSYECARNHLYDALRGMKGWWEVG